MSTSAFGARCWRGLEADVLFALITETPLVHAGALAKMAPALEQNALHCARAWGLEQPAVSPCSTVDNLPHWAHPIVFVAGGGDAGVLAEHYYDPVRSGPACRVYVDQASGLEGGDYSVSEAASHEIVEALVNPRINLWSPHPLRPALQLPREVADPVQSAYRITAHGTAWQVSNFVTPYWFDSAFVDPEQRRRLRAAGERFDHLGELTEPGQIGREGYVVLLDPATGRTWLEFGPDGDLAARKRAAIRHPWSRTRRLGIQLTEAA
jgi:hypothetical protein